MLQKFDSRFEMRSNNIFFRAAGMSDWEKQLIGMPKNHQKNNLNTFSYQMTHTGQKNSKIHHNQKHFSALELKSRPVANFEYCRLDCILSLGQKPIA